MEFTEVQVCDGKITINKSDLQAELDRIINAMEDCRMLDDAIRWTLLAGKAEIIKEILRHFLE